jgi:hypothetical protein
MRTAEEIKDYRKQHYWQNRDKYIKKAREWKLVNRSRATELGQISRDNNRSHLRELSKSWKRDPDACKKYRGKHPERYEAYKIFYNALRRGEIPKIEHCQNCNSTENIHAHHGDYGKPLDVVWLCSLCHGKTRRYACMA